MSSSLIRQTGTPDWSNTVYLLIFKDQEIEIIFISKYLLTYSSTMFKGRFFKNV